MEFFKRFSRNFFSIFRLLSRLLRARGEWDEEIVDERVEEDDDDDDEDDEGV